MSMVELQGSHHTNPHKLTIGMCVGFTWLSWWMVSLPVVSTTWQKLFTTERIQEPHVAVNKSSISQRFSHIYDRNLNLIIVTTLLDLPVDII